MADKKKKASPQGIRISPEVHDLMTTVAAITGMQVGEAYTEAAAEWLRRQGSASPIVRSLLDLKCSSSSELRSLVGKKPSLLANRA